MWFYNRQKKKRARVRFLARNSTQLNHRENVTLCPPPPGNVMMLAACLGRHRKKTRAVKK